MRCRNVIIVLTAAGLLGGCDAYNGLRRDLGVDPVDPPRPQTAVPAAPAGNAMTNGTMAKDAMAKGAMTKGAMTGDAAANGAMANGAMAAEPAMLPVQPRSGIAQANWAAQRTAAMTQQDNTTPVDYKPPPVPAAPAEAKAGPMPIAPQPGAAGKPPAPPAKDAGGMAAAKPGPAAAKPPAAGARPADMAMKAGTMKDGPMKDGAAPKPAGSEVWRAHLASHRTEWAAINEWQELLKAGPKLYGQLDPQITWTELPNRGSYARLTFGSYPDRKAAEAACAVVRGPRRYCAPLKD
ncbi:SPOR domain-containing protein [Ferrovibrio sp.]|uniref:SPOR domain-containing protein n=1 Tax=Ferrovibrio sp. TaxID=1917215 RepID=UPI003515CE4F